MLANFCSTPPRGVRRALDTKTHCHVTNLTNGGRFEFATPRHTFSLCWETSVHGSLSPAVPPGGATENVYGLLVSPMFLW